MAQLQYLEKTHIQGMVIQMVNKLLMEKQIADILKILKNRTNVHNPYRDIIYLMYILKTLEL